MADNLADSRHIPQALRNPGRSKVLRRVLRLLAFMTGDDRLSTLQLTRLTILADSAGGRPRPAQSGLFGKLERRHDAFRTTFSIAASVTLLKHLEKFAAPAIAS